MSVMLRKIDVPKVLVAVLFVLVLLAPLGAYHCMSDTISGTMWGFMVPVGYVAAIAGSLLLLSDKLCLSRFISTPRLLILTGISVITVHVAQSQFLEIFLGASTGVQGLYDVDFYSTVLSFPSLVSFLAIAVGLLRKRVL